MRGCVFVGPTLDARAAGRFSGLSVLPPAAAGDVYRAALAGYRTLLLIDGYFHSAPSVQHKEILYALDQGLRVYGCSSMGALRAAELADFGMVGIGALFRQYRDGLLTDDEVAVAHGDADSGYRTLSVPMVTIRQAVALALAEGVLTPDVADVLVRLAKSLFYADRHWGSMSALARREGVPDRQLDGLLALVATQNPDIKRDDALEALAVLARTPGTVRQTTSSSFEPTHHWSEFARQETP